MRHSPLFALGAILSLAACATYEPDRTLPTLNDTLDQRGISSIARQDIDPAILEPLDGTVTMDRAAASALRNNAELQATLEDLNLADAQRIQSGLLFNPSLTGEFVIESPGEPWELNFGLGLDLSRLFTRSWRMRTAEAEQEAVKAEVAELIVSTVIAARMGVFELWASAQNLSIARDIARARKAAVLVAEEFRRVGNLETGRLARAKALLARAELDAAMAELALLDAKARLADVSGRPLGLAIEADLSVLPEAPSDKAGFVRESLTKSFVLEADRARLRAIGARYGLAKIEAWLSHIEGGAVLERDGEWGEGFEVGLPLPVFDLGRTRSGAAKAALQAAEYRYKAHYLATGNRAAALFEALTRLVQMDETRGTSLKAAAEGDYDFEAQRFNAMQIGPLLLLEARINQLLADQAALSLKRERLATHMEVLALKAGVTMMRDRGAVATGQQGAVPEGDH